MSLPGNHPAFLERLKKRKYLNIALIYLGSAMVVMHFAEIVFPALHLPHWSVSLVVVLALAGLPVILLISWAFTFQPPAPGQAEQKEAADDTPVQPAIKTVKKPGRIILALSLSIILFTAAIFIYNRFIYQSKFTGAEKSIAVLPFKNISGDKNNEYFSDGITEDIITQLAKVSDLKVISRTSVMQYKNTTKNLKEIAKELNVAAILEGSVQKEGKSIRITAQLIDANTDESIWAEKYDRSIEQVFAIQSDVAQEIAYQLNARLSSDERNRIKAGQTENIDAYENYLKGRQLVYSPDDEETKKAVSFFENAIEQDSAYELAWAGLAEYYLQMGIQEQNNNNIIPYYNGMALNAALKAVQYGPQLSESHMALGEVLKRINQNPASSLEEMQIAMRLNPGNAPALAYMSYSFSQLKKFKQADSVLSIAERLDPLSPFIKTARAFYYHDMRDAEKFMKEIDLFVDTSAKNYAACKTYQFILQNKYDSLLLISRQWPEPSDGFYAAIAYINLGQPAKAQEIINHLVTQSELDNAYDIAQVYAQLNNKERALHYLNIAYRTFDPQLFNVNNEKLLDPLRNDPGFKELLKRMGME